MHDEQLYSQAEREFTTTLLNARKNLIRRARQIHPDLQAPGFRLIALLGRNDGQQQGALAEQLDLDQATISRMVKNLEAMGLVQRAVDPADGRAQLVSLTSTARANWESSGQYYSQKLRSRIDAWSPEELVRFIDLLQRLNAPDDED